MNIDLILEAAGAILGFIYLWLEYKASIYLWFVGIIMPAIYIYIYYKGGLYADFGINIYYLLAGIYGFVVWSVAGKRKRVAGSNSSVKELKISNIPRNKMIYSVIAALVFWVLIYLILTNFTDSTVPVADSFTTAVSMVAMWLLTRKYIEQWYAWSMVNAVSCVLYIHKDLYFTSILYGVYFIATILGYSKWKRMMTQK